MKAVVYYGVNDIRYEPNWPDVRPLKKDEVKIEVSWCGICGTDMEDYKYGGFIPVDKPHPESGKKAPIVIGHEYSGRVAEIGKDVKNLTPGQKVAIECVRVCHRCYWCKRGEYASCTNQVSLGQADDGGMADFLIVPAENCIPVPEDTPDDIIALVEPLAVMVRAINKGRIRAGTVVTVVGAGTIGLMGIAAASAAGASKVIAITHGGKRAEVASEMGATHVLNSKEEGWREEFLNITSGLGSEVVIDTGGNIEAIRMAVGLTMQRGRCVINSVVADDMNLPVVDFVINEKELIGTVAHSTNREFAWALQFLKDGRIDVNPMVTSRIYIANAVEQGFNRLIQDRNQIKVLVTPKKELIS
jgi:(R,R)-butanediol dehydrogenase / meso-butanediol dehydrogenase / diacetyl reductase